MGLSIGEMNLKVLSFLHKSAEIIVKSDAKRESVVKEIDSFGDDIDTLTKLIADSKSEPEITRAKKTLNYYHSAKAFLKKAVSVYDSELKAKEKIRSAKMKAAEARRKLVENNDKLKAERDELRKKPEPK